MSQPRLRWGIQRCCSLGAAPRRPPAATHHELKQHPALSSSALYKRNALRAVLPARASPAIACSPSLLRYSMPPGAQNTAQGCPRGGPSRWLRLLAAPAAPSPLCCCRNPHPHLPSVAFLLWVHLCCRPRSIFPPECPLIFVRRAGAVCPLLHPPAARFFRRRRAALRPQRPHTPSVTPSPLPALPLAAAFIWMNLLPTVTPGPPPKQNVALHLLLLFSAPPVRCPAHPGPLLLVVRPAADGR